MAYIVGTDSFLSGWGAAKGGRSLYAIEVTTSEEAQIVMENMMCRSDMKRVRYNLHKPRTRKGDQLTVVTRVEAPRYFVKGAFKKR